MTDTNIQPSIASSAGTNRTTIARHATGWGYRVTRAKAMRTSMDLLESCLTLGGAVSVMLTAGLWLLPGSAISADVIGIKLGLSLLIGIGGLALLQVAHRGMNRELHVDRRRRQIRHVWRNRKGETQLHNVIEFDEIGSLFLRRHPVAGHMTHLFVRVIDIPEPIEVFAGTEAEMQGLWNSLKTDLRGVPPRSQKTTAEKTRILRRAQQKAAVTERGVAQGDVPHRVVL